MLVWQACPLTSITQQLLCDHRFDSVDLTFCGGCGVATEALTLFIFPPNISMTSMRQGTTLPTPIYTIHILIIITSRSITAIVNCNNCSFNRSARPWAC